MTGDPTPATPPDPADDDAIIPLDELEAAWQEVESVGEPQPAPAPVEPAAQQSAGQQQHAVPDEPPASGRSGRRVRFMISRQKQDDAATARQSHGPEGDGPPAPAARDAETATRAQTPVAAARRKPEPEGPPAFLPRVPWWKRLLRASDDLLDVLNRPFATLSPQTRSLIGTVSVTTIVVSLMTAWLLPTLFPHRDAITFLEAARARVHSHKPASESTSGGRESARAGPDADRPGARG